MDEPLRQKLLSAAAEFGVKLDEPQVLQFDRYLSLLLEWNQVMNLTAITQPEEIVVKHFADSLSLLKYTALPQGASLIDVGTGAGFPGVPLKIARPDLKLTCLDSLNKRIQFLKTLCGGLGLNDVECLHARAEEGARKPELRARFDAATARAVANLRSLSEYCLPFVKTGGVFIAMKGPDVDAELAEAKHAIGILGGEVERVHTFVLPGAEAARSLLLIRKKAETPAAYPRNPAQMTKKPL